MLGILYNPCNCPTTPEPEAGIFDDTFSEEFE